MVYIDEIEFIGRSENHLISAALSLRKAKKYEEAIKILEIVLEKDEQNIDALTLMSLVTNEMGDAEKAVSILSKILSFDEENLNTLKSLGLVLISNDRHKEGLKYLINYVQLNNWEDVSVLDAITSAAFKVGEEDPALNILKQAWISSLNPMIGILYGRLLRNFEHYDDAIPILELLANHNDRHEYWNELGINYFRERRFVDSESAFQEAVNSAKTFHLWISSEEEFDHEMTLAETIIDVYYGNLALAYLQQNKNEIALETADLGLEHTPYSTYLWENKIKALMNLSRYEEAIDAAQQTVETLQENQSGELKDIYILLADAYQKAGNLDQAIATLEIGKNEYPKTIRFYREISKIYESKGEVEKSLEILREAFKEVDLPESDSMDDGNFVFNSLLADYYRFLFQVEGPIEAWKEFNPYFEKYPSVLLNIVVALEFSLMNDDSEEVDRSVKMAEQLYKKGSNDPYIINLMFLIHFRMEDFEKAGLVLEKAVKLELSMTFLLPFLNNLGYVYILQKKFKLAKDVLQNALKVEDIESYISEIAGHGIAYYLDGEILDGNWLNHRNVIGNLPPSWMIRNMQIVVKCNLATLALIEDDLDQANAIALELVNRKIESFNNPINPLLLFISRYRNDPKSARFAWRRIIKEDNPLLEKDEMKDVYPDFYKWMKASGVFEV